MYAALVFQFFIEALGFAVIFLAFFAEGKTGSTMPKGYAAYLLSSLAFLSVRNAAFFLDGVQPESKVLDSLLFMFFFNLSNAAYGFCIIDQAVSFVRYPLPKIYKTLRALAALLPLLITVAAAIARMTGHIALFPQLYKAGMYTAFLAYLLACVYLLLHYRRLSSPLKRMLAGANCIAGMFYLVLSLVFYLDFLTGPYYLDSFWILNATLSIIFAGSLVAIVRHEIVFHAPDKAAPAVVSAHIEEYCRDLVSLLLKGLTNEEIAHALGVSTSSVKSRLYRLYRRMGVQSRNALINALKNPEGSNVGSPGDASGQSSAEPDCEPRIS